MLLPEALAYSLADANGGSISELKVYCDLSVTDELKKCFVELFQSYWDEGVAYTEDEFEREPGTLKEDNPAPIYVENTEHGFFASLGSFEVDCVNTIGFKYNCSEYTWNVLDQTLDALRKKFYNLFEYDGHICYTIAYDDLNNVVQYEVSSRKNNGKNEAYDFIGKILAEELSDDDSDFWDIFEASLNDCHENEENYESFIETLNALYIYKKYIESSVLESTVNKLVEIFIEADSWNEPENAKTEDELKDIAKRILSDEKVEMDNKSSHDALIANLYANQHNKGIEKSSNDFIQEYEEELLKAIKELGLD